MLDHVDISLSVKRQQRRHPKEMGRKKKKKREQPFFVFN
jgi:hypothetical protein